MSIEGSLNQSIDKAVKHYSSLFKLPVYRHVVLTLVLLVIGGGTFSIIVLFPSVEGLLNGLFLSITLFFINVVIDYFLSAIVLRNDPIYNLRRTAALSLFCWIVWFFFIFIGVFVSFAFGLLWWVRLCLLGFSANLIFRLVVLFSTSSASNKRLLVASLIHPFSGLVPFMVLWTRTTYLVATNVFLFLAFSLTVSLASSFLFMVLLDHEGKRTTNVPSLSLLKAFLLNWVVDLNAPLEDFLEKLGETRDVEVSLIKFDSPTSHVILVIPSIHPGPFKNIGSSLLPSALKTALEKKLNCVACIPHGLLGHEFDLASQLQNEKIASRIIESADFEGSEAKVSPFVKVSNGLATATCQIFGKSALLSFSLAPRTTEDLPQELGEFVRQEAERHGLACYAVVNAHNSINGTVDMQEALVSLKTVARTCLEKATSLPMNSFDVGAATVIPAEFSLKDGMGPGGITVVAVAVDNQRTAYVVVDGNNMVSGLREKILSSLQAMGIGDGEVFTTDTHAVNAIVLNERGYHPVGEIINQGKLVEHIKMAASAALSNMRRVKAACCRITVPDVKVIGEKPLERLCLLIDKTLQRAKNIVAPIFVTSGLLLMLFLTFV